MPNDSQNLDSLVPVDPLTSEAVWILDNVDSAAMCRAYVGYITARQIPLDLFVVWHASDGGRPSPNFLNRHCVQRPCVACASKKGGWCFNWYHRSWYDAYFVSASLTTWRRPVRPVADRTDVVRVLYEVYFTLGDQAFAQGVTVRQMLGL